jgi:predicted DCC family thiol-disulfide oxidoreductase YuxK
MLPLQQDTISEQQTATSIWKIKLLFDGACPLCVREVNFLKCKDGDSPEERLLLRQTLRERQRGLIKFVDIAAEDYDPADNANIDFETAMGRIHAVLPNGKIVRDVEVFRQIYDILGIGWIYAVTKLPLVGSLADLLYGVWADYRLLLTGRANLNTIVAQRQQLRKDKEFCDDGCAIAKGRAKPNDNGSKL